MYGSLLSPNTVFLQIKPVFSSNAKEFRKIQRRLRKNEEGFRIGKSPDAENSHRSESRDRKRESR